MQKTNENKSEASSSQPLLPLPSFPIPQHMQMDQYQQPIIPFYPTDYNQSIFPYPQVGQQSMYPQVGQQSMYPPVVIQVDDSPYITIMNVRLPLEPLCAYAPVEMIFYCNFYHKISPSMLLRFVEETLRNVNIDVNLMSEFVNGKKTNIDDIIRLHYKFPLMSKYTEYYFNCKENTYNDNGLGHELSTKKQLYEKYGHLTTMATNRRDILESTDRLPNDFDKVLINEYRQIISYVPDGFPEEHSESEMMYNHEKYQIFSLIILYTYLRFKTGSLLSKVSHRIRESIYDSIKTWFGERESIGFDPAYEPDVCLFY